MQTTGKLTAANNVIATSTNGAMTIGGDVSASNNITLTSKETMQTTGKLTAANDVTATSTDGAMTIGGDVSASNNITLTSKETMQTTGKLASVNDVNLTSTSGDVTISGDVTTGKQLPNLEGANSPIPLEGTYNALVIKAGGAIQEAEGVNIDTPVVETYSGKGVSLESAKNTFGIFLADGVDNSKEIDGSVKVATNYYKGEDDSVVTIGLGASVLGDAEFSNLNPNGGLGILVWHPDDKNRNISILGGNGAKGDLVLKASQDVGLLGDAYAVHDVVVKSTNGSFYGIGRSITAENDVNVSVADSVYYIGGTGKALYAGHDIIIEATNPASDDAGIYIGALPDNINLMDVMNGTASVEEAPTKLWAGNNANFNVNGNGDIDLEGDVIAEAGKVSATVAGKGDITVGNEEGVAETTIMAQKDVTLKTEEGNIKVSKGIQSTEESVSVQTGKGDITVGRDNVVDGKTITAKKDVSVGTDLGTIYIQGETSTETGDITMKAGKDKYEVGSDSGNFVIRDDGQVNSGGSVTLNGRNGDIHITDDIKAKKGLTASITEQGNVYFDTNVSVTNDVNITTDKGKIDVGHTVNAETGTVKMQTRDGDISIGADVTAGSDVDMKTAIKGDITVGADVTAGNDVKMKVNTGDVTVGVNVTGDDASSSGKGNVVAKNGDVTVDISGKGNVGITKSVDSQNGSVSVKTKEGNINIGSANVKDDKTVTAKENVNVETDLGTIYVLGMTSTETGDITMKAGKDKYEVGSDSGNFVIRDDGQVNSGGSVTLNGRNGDIHITDDIKAKKGLTASITEQGNVYFDTNVSVTNDVNITTDKGKIDVGHTVNAETGTVKMQTRDGDISIGADVTAGSDVDMKTAIKGDITVGADVTAGNDVKMKVNTGDVTVGVNVTGDDASSSGKGNVVAKNGDVTVDISGKGNVGITKSVDSQNGSVSVKTKEGNINIGSANVKDDKTVTAKENVNVETDLGTIYILGMTSTENGDITMKAGKDSYQADEGSGEDLVQNGNFIIKDDGKVNSGGAVNLKGRNGDIHITDAIEAKKGITTNITEKGNVYFDREVNVKDDVNITTEDGSIAIGKTVTSTEGNVNLQTGTGSILIGQDVTAEKDITITTKEGSVIVGDTDTGGDGDVLSKKGDVSIQTSEGVVGIVKSVKAQEGSIDIQVGTGGVAIGNNGPGVETVSAYKNIDVAVDLGRIEINGKTSTKKGDISMSAAESEYVPGGQNIIIAQNGELDSGRDARLTGRNGDLHVTDAVKAVRNLNAKVLDEGDIVYDKTVNVNGDVTAKTDKGSISVAKEVTGNLVDLDTGKGNITVSGDIRSNTDVTMHTGTGDISVKNINAQGNTTISDTGRGNVNGNNIVSGGTTHVSLTKGDLFLNLAEGKAVVLRMEDNTKASKVGTVLADASGGAGPDVELTGNYIPIGTLAAKNGNAVFEVTAMGANNQKLISGEITVGSLRSRTNTHMPTLWANRGNIHVDEGDLAIDDVLAVDKIHLENKLTDLAIFGRTPTRDGEQLYYWNNLEMANSKTRPFTLYANGKVRTHRAVLIDAGRYYGKLYGDNLSVVDMMRERLTNEHGQYTFDRTWYTKPGEVLKEKVLFGMDTVDEDIRRHNASSGQLM